MLGKTFTSRGLLALSPQTEDVEGLLASLVRKELLYLDTDPRSPERGHYGFLQALVQRVAYETLSRRDRKAKHLAAALAPLDYANLDDLPEFAGAVTTTEFLCRWVAERLAPDAPANVDALEVTLREHPDAPDALRRLVREEVYEAEVAAHVRSANARAVPAPRVAAVD